MKLTTYKCRAECPYDIFIFIDHFHKDGNYIHEMKMENIGTGVPSPDKEFEFSTNAPLNKIKSVMNEITDSHVMVQTVEKKGNYTGDRF